MNTAYLLMAQYNAAAVIPIKIVCRDYFSHLSPENLVRKASASDLDLPVVRMDDGHKAAKGVALVDLAAYLDRRIEAARKECRQLSGSGCHPTL
jgi:hypothetical protein